MPHTGGPPHGPVVPPSSGGGDSTDGSGGNIFDIIAGLENADPGTFGNGSGTTDAYSEVLQLHWAWGIPELRGFIQGWITKLSHPDFVYDPYFTEDLFQAELENQPWWQNNHQAFRDAEQQRTDDPETWNENVRVHAEDYQRLASQLGYTLTWDEAQTLAEGSLRSVTGGHGTEVMERGIMAWKAFSAGTDTPEVGVGSIRGSYDKFRGIAANNLVNLQDGDYWNWAHKVQADQMTDEQVEQAIFDHAKGQYDFIDEDRWDRWRANGTSLSSYLNTRREAVAGAWGLQANEVDWNDQFMQDNLVFTGDDGQERFRTSKELRQLAKRNEDGTVNSRYEQTLDYKSRTSGFKNTMLQTLGAI